MRAVITGGTGFVGSHLCKYLGNNGYSVDVLTRNPDKYKDQGNIKYISYDETESAIDGSDVVINLAGENLFDNKWTDEIKSRILKSRINTTRRVVEAVRKTSKKPNVFISASAVGYYGDNGDKIRTEADPAGSDYLSRVCMQWEEEARKVQGAGVRLVIPRMGIVLEKSGGALDKMLTPFYLFAGGPLGSGKQYFPWIHMDDVCRSMKFAMDTDSLSGVINVTAPNPVTMKEFAATLGKTIHRPSFFKVPEFALKIVLGEAAEALIASLNVHPENLKKAGFKFKYETADEALKEILKE